MEFYNFILELIRYLFGGGIFILVILYGVYPVIRYLRKPLNPARELKRSKTTVPLEEINTAHEDQPAKKNKSLEILQIAQQDPKKTAQLLRGWLAENKKENKQE